MPAPQHPQRHVGQHFYPLYRRFPVRRDATRVCAGYFDKFPQFESYPPPPPFDQREQFVLGSLPNGSSADLLDDSPPHLASPASGSSTEHGPATLEAGPSQRMGSGDRISDAVPSGSSQKSSVTPARSGKSKGRSHKKGARGVSPRDPRPKISNTPKTQSNLRHVLAPEAPPEGVEGASTTTATNATKRPLEDEPVSQDRPPKRARSLHAPSSSATTSTAIEPPQFYSGGNTNGTANTSVRHASSSATPSLSPSPPSHLASPRQHSAGRRRVAVQKGWKGWVIADDDAIDESRLIKVDEPIVLSKTRQTRSGRAFADVREYEEWQGHRSWS